MKQYNNQKKGIIFFMPEIGVGGVENNLFNISNYLSKKIKNIKIFTNTKNLNNKFDDKIEIISSKFKYFNYLNLRLKYFICLVNLYLYLKKNKNFIVFSFQANVYCVVICKLLNIKIIVRSNTSPLGWKHNFIKKKIYKFFMKKADIFLVNSFEFKNQIKDEYELNAKCILNPLDKKKIIKRSKNKCKYYFKNTKKNILRIINIGRLTDQKDQITILKAIKLIRNIINFELLIIGNGYEKKNLCKFIKKNKLNHFVKIINFKANHYPILKQAEIFILSSLFEGLPNVLLEAACLKKFVISSRCPSGPTEILKNGKGGFLYDIKDYAGLARKILLYSKKKKILKNKIRVNYQNLKRYNYYKNLGMHYKLVKKLI
jgi:glycosyltransferase involved in cell wall biosynthesis